MQTIQARFPKCGVEVVSVQRYPVPTASFKPQLAAIKQANPDAIYLATIGTSENTNVVVQARQLGITYTANAASRAGGEIPGWIGEVVGTNSWELPQPAVIAFTAGGLVLFVDVSPDWLVRTEASSVLSALSVDA